MNKIILYACFFAQVAFGNGTSRHDYLKKYCDGIDLIESMQIGGKSKSQFMLEFADSFFGNVYDSITDDLLMDVAVIDNKERGRFELLLESAIRFELQNKNREAISKILASFNIKFIGFVILPVSLAMDDVENLFIIIELAEKDDYYFNLLTQGFPSLYKADDNRTRFIKSCHSWLDKNKSLLQAPNLYETEYKKSECTWLVFKKPSTPP